MMTELFLGKSASYWLELDRRMAEGGSYRDRTEMLEEIVCLRGKVDFYESRIEQMATQIRRK